MLHTSTTLLELEVTMRI
uniref:Uncharacterized protein n=1 Tax=Anguilla anguilla TaxID=7936 RepID=A0A0E9PJV3_ANGAN